MNLNQLKEKLKNNSLPNKLVFVGEELYMQKHIINTLAKLKNANVHYYNDYDDIKESLFINDFFSEAEVFVIRDSKYFMKNPKKFKDILIPEDKVLILIYSEYEPKKELFSENKDFVYEFNKMGENQLKMIIKNTLSDLSDDNCKKFCEIVDYDCSRLVLELDKLKILHSLDNKDVNDLFVESVEEDLIHEENTCTIYNLVNAIRYIDLNKALELSNKIDKQPDDIFRLINKIYEECKTNVLYNKKKLFFLQQLEKDIKTGKIDNDMAYDYLLIKLLTNTEGDSYEN